MTITNNEPLDCTHLPSGKVLNYYTHGIEIWLPVERYGNFLKYINKPDIFKHEGSQKVINNVLGVTIKRTV